MIERSAKKIESPRAIVRLSVFIVTLPLLAACSARPFTGDLKPTELDMNPLVIRPQGKLLDAQTLF